MNREPFFDHLKLIQAYKYFRLSPLGIDQPQVSEAIYKPMIDFNELYEELEALPCWDMVAMSVMPLMDQYRWSPMAEREERRRQIYRVIEAERGVETWDSENIKALVEAMR